MLADPPLPNSKAGRFVAELHGHGPVSFDLLVLHYCEAYQGDTADPDRESKQAEFQAMLAEFATREGQLTSQFWCRNVRGATVLTNRDRLFSAGDPYKATADLPLARLVGRTDTLARLVEEQLVGPARRTSLEFLYALETNALGCMDELASEPQLSPDAASNLREVTEAKFRTDLAIIEDYVAAAAQRRAQLTYLQGMLLVVMATFAASAGIAWVTLGSRDLLAGTELVPAALFLGSLGAVVSVMQRLTQGKLRIRLEAGLTAVRLLGFFRPFVGSILAFAALILVLGGLVPLAPPTDPAGRAFFFGGLAFLAGFSERFAQDMIGAGKAGSTINTGAALTNVIGSERPDAPTVRR